MEALLVIFLCATSFAEENTFIRDGSNLTLVCTGEASSVELARKASLQSCINSASDALNRNFNVKNLSVETEHGAWIHEEVEYTQKVENLVCNLASERIEQTPEFIRVWDRCRFDLSKAKVTSNEHKAEPVTRSIASQKLISLSSSPQCDSILVVGVKGRVIDCKKNPVNFTQEIGDRYLIVRASSFQPKTVPLKEEPNSIGVNYDVILDR